MSPITITFVTVNHEDFDEYEMYGLDAYYYEGILYVMKNDKYEAIHSKFLEDCEMDTIGIYNHDYKVIDSSDLIKPNSLKMIELTY